MKLNITRIETDESMVEWNEDNTKQVPRQDALIFHDRIVCHPSIEDKVRNGLAGFLAAMQNDQNGEIH